MRKEILSLVASPGQPVATAEACSLHRYHRPQPTYCELHHVIPQAWQRFWQPPGEPSSRALEWETYQALRQPEFPLSEFPLFDPRTVAICRTGHGNVHAALVLMMREFADGGYPDPLPGEMGRLMTVLGVFITTHPRPGRKEIEVAKLAIVRWVEAGGSLRALCEAKLYGQI